MISIINKLSTSEKSVTLYDIQSVSRACVPDTMEATDMLSYLTSFGKVIETPEGWIRVDEKKSPKEPRRYYYIKEIVLVVKSISNDEPLTPHQLADKVGLQVAEVAQYLQFLKEITSVGQVIVDTNGYPYNYHLEPHLTV